jgi:hypothetical protein
MARVGHAQYAAVLVHHGHCPQSSPGKDEQGCSRICYCIDASPQKASCTDGHDSSERRDIPRQPPIQARSDAQGDAPHEDSAGDGRQNCHTHPYHASLPTANNSVGTDADAYIAQPSAKNGQPHPPLFRLDDA